MVGSGETTRVPNRSSQALNPPVTLYQIPAGWTGLTPECARPARHLV
jgi:hypothetical protein